MIPELKEEIFHVSCKNKLTGKIEKFPIAGYSFSDACESLFYILSDDWIVGFGSM